MQNSADTQTDITYQRTVRIVVYLPSARGHSVLQALSHIDRTSSIMHNAKFMTTYLCLSVISTGAYWSWMLCLTKYFDSSSELVPMLFCALIQRDRCIDTSDINGQFSVGLEPTGAWFVCSRPARPWLANAHLARFLRGYAHRCGWNTVSPSSCRMETRAGEAPGYLIQVWKSSAKFYLGHGE